MTQHSEGFYDGNGTFPTRITTGMSGRMRKVHITTTKAGRPSVVYRSASMVPHGVSTDYEGEPGDPGAIKLDGADFILLTKDVNEAETRYYWEAWAE